METLYPIFYGTRMVTFDVLRDTFEPHMHPEAWRRGSIFILSQEGKFGIGSGFRPPGTQPNKPGFATPGRSFHEKQRFPSGIFYAAWDMVVVNPGGKHRAPRLDEVPRQGSQFAFAFGWHMNIDSEPWHAQPIELDGWGAWTRDNRPDLQPNYEIVLPEPPPSPYIPPLPPLVPVTENQPLTKGIVVEFTSRTLTEGTSGNDVKFFQRQLNEIAGQGLLLDGKFGPATSTAVRNWQMFFKLESIDGELGPKTQRSIIEISLLS